MPILEEIYFTLLVRELLGLTVLCSCSASKFLSFESCLCYGWVEMCHTSCLGVTTWCVYYNTGLCCVSRASRRQFYQLHSCSAVDFLVFVIGCCLVSMKSKISSQCKCVCLHRNCVIKQRLNRQNVGKLQLFNIGCFVQSNNMKLNL